MENKILSQETRMEGRRLVITRTVEEHVTKENLESEINTCRMQLSQLVAQSQQIKAQYDSWSARLADIESLLENFEEESLVVL